MAKNEKKPEPTPKPNNSIPESKIQKIPPTPRPSKGIRVRLRLKAIKQGVKKGERK